MKNTNAKRVELLFCFIIVAALKLGIIMYYREIDVFCFTYFSLFRYSQKQSIHSFDNVTN